MQTEEDKKVVAEVLKTHPAHDDFVVFFTMVLNGKIGNSVPYIKNATPEQKKAYVEKLWDYLQKRDIDGTIGGR